MPSSAARSASMVGSAAARWRLTSITWEMRLPTSTLPLRSGSARAAPGCRRSRTPLVCAAAWAVGALMTCRNHSRANSAAKRQATTTTRTVSRTCTDSWGGGAVTVLYWLSEEAWRVESRDSSGRAPAAPRPGGPSAGRTRRGPAHEPATGRDSTAASMLSTTATLISQLRPSRASWPWPTRSPSRQEERHPGDGAHQATAGTGASLRAARRRRRAPTSESDEAEAQRGEPERRVLQETDRPAGRRRSPRSRPARVRRPARRR